MTGFASVFRKSATSLAPFATRLARLERKHQYPLLSNVLNRSTLSQKPSTGSFTSILQYSTAAKKLSSDEFLLRVIDTEIKYSLETDDYERVEETPSGFPFVIKDNPGFQTIILSREYQGELVKAEVHMPNLVTGEKDDEVDDDDDDDGQNEKANQSSLPLVVTISKTGFPSLEFSCTAYADEIAIDRLIVSHTENSSEEPIAYEGPDFNDLDENLQKGFHKYLEIRGIKPSTTNFLHEYMINKDTREYSLWLNHLKKFMEA